MISHAEWVQIGVALTAAARESATSGAPEVRLTSALDILRTFSEGGNWECDKGKYFFTSFFTSKETPKETLMSCPNEASVECDCGTDICTCIPGKPKLRKWSSKSHADSFRAWRLGVREGFRQPYDLQSGITWSHDQGLNESFDSGATVGQNLGKFWNLIQKNLRGTK